MHQIARLTFVLVATALIVGGCDGDGDTAASQPVHPALECKGGRDVIGNYDLIGPGFTTAGAALDDRLGYYRNLHGGEIVELSENEAALRVDGAVVVVAVASSAAEGGFLVYEDYSCDGFEPQPGPLLTVPPITAS